MVDKIEGVAPDAPIHRHESGGLESKPAGDFVRSFPARGVLSVAKVMLHGLEKYAPNNWRLIQRRSHINHAITHLFAYTAGDTQDDHLEHAAARLLMALDMPEDRPYDTPEAGCAKCATDWTDAQHDGDCKHQDIPTAREACSICYHECEWDSKSLKWICPRCGTAWPPRQAQDGDCTVKSSGNRLEKARASTVRYECPHCGLDSHHWVLPNGDQECVACHNIIAFNVGGNDEAKRG